MSGAKRKSYIPYSYKMMIPYLLLVLVTDALIGTISYRMLVESRTEIARTNIQAAMQQTRTNMHYQMEEIKRISDTLFGSVPFQRALQKRGDELQAYLTMLDEIVPKLQEPLQLFGNPLRIELYTTNPDLYEIEGDDPSTKIERSDYYVLSADRLRGSAWAEQAGAGDGSRWMQVESDAEHRQLSHLTRLLSYSDYQTAIGYIRITARLDDLLGRFDAFPVEKGMTLRLLDQPSGRTLYEKGDAHEADAPGHLTLSEAVPGSGYVIQAVVSQRYLQEDARRLGLVIVGVCSVSFAVMALIGFMVARLSGRKMRKIVTLVQSFQDGSLEKRIRFSGKDEFVQIADAFNTMAEHVKELISSVFAQGQKRKQAELEALQAQINPHFLYNTLSTISSLANMGETRQVTEMVKGLSRFYRLSLNEGRVLIPLGQELEQVQTYLDIQRVKYADAFTVHLDAEPDIGELRVMKLILQPFVENVFKHAWYGESIAIRITARRLGADLELKVIDNGVGMNAEALERLRSGTAGSAAAPAASGLAGEPSEFAPAAAVRASGSAGAGGSYGIRNVDERIRLRYGERYGIEVGSVFGGGTTVRILLPAEGEWEDGIVREEKEEGR
ncbi:sensor histidine kinase [Paenibacillus sp. B01]|uniref:sensor histidine kinase n=1 Tax=Paenibacillus sp. B01 TaxID=2660554 RepID=UPI00129B17AE|nr:sensor histidine kinase [Paenibacillus sp. B01]QGG55209.1 HAMP domain-containing protein [Paenibacillus sp. B01]